MNYFRMLDQYANMYMQKHEKLMKGDKYYNGLYEKITNLCKLGNEWMIKRSDEKNAILSTIGGPSAYKSGGNSGNYLTASALLDPNRNPFTKMNVANINQQKSGARPMGNDQGRNNNNQGGYGGNQGNFNNQGGYGGNQGGYGGNQGGYGGNQGNFNNQGGYGGNQGGWH